MNVLLVAVLLFFFILILVSIVFYREKLIIYINNKAQEVVSFISSYRYLVVVLFTFLIILLGIYLYFSDHWTFKDVAQVCTGFLLVITLFFAALNYEFTATKTK